MASTMKTLVVLLVVFSSMSKPLALFPNGKEQERPVETKVVTDLQDRYNALTAPGIIMLPASGISAVSMDLLSQIEKELFKQMANTGKLKPVRMQRWLLTTYTNKANNPFSIMNAIKAEQYVIPLQYIGKPVVFIGDSLCYFGLYVYPLESYYPIIIFRQFLLSDSVDNLISSCIEELYLRLSQPVTVGTRKRIVIDDFKLDFLRLIELPSGEFDFISTPFFDARGITLRDGDDFFSRTMGYILTTTDMFQAIQIGDFKEYSNAVISNTDTLVDYRVQGRVQLSEHECVLYVDVIDVHSGAKMVSIRHPLLLYSFEKVWNAYREISVQIIEKLYNKESYGIVPPLDSQGRCFYTNNMFMGWDVLKNCVLPRGLHVISTGSAYGIEKKSDSVNFYHVLLDYQDIVYTDMEGKHIWNLLKK
jgi:hypothetical protein